MKRSDYISRQEAASILGVDEQTISNYITRKIVSYKQIGKMKYVKRAEIEEMKDQFFEYEANRSRLAELIAEQADLSKKVQKQISSYRSRLEDLYAAEDYIFSSLRAALLIHRDLYNEREQYIIDKICENESLSFHFGDICERFDLSRDRVRQIVVKILQRLSEKQFEQAELRKGEQNRLYRLEGLLEAYQFAGKLQDRRSAVIQTITGYSSEIFSTRLVDLNISVRCLNCIKSADIETIADLVTYEKRDLLKFRNFGKKSLTELDDLVESLGLHFGMTESEIFSRTAINYENAPEHIFLHTGIPLAHGEDLRVDFDELSEVTWNSERVSDTDIVYKRI